MNISSNLLDFSLIQYDNEVVLEGCNMKPNNLIMTMILKIWLGVKQVFKEDGSCIDLVLMDHKCLIKF